MHTLLDNELEPSLSNPGEGLREYHVAYTGKFRKGDQPFELTQQKLDHWRDTLLSMVKEGIDVPGPIGHVLSPTATKAQWIGARTGPDSKGRYSLWATAKFADETTSKDLANSKVSLWAPGDAYKSATSDKVFQDPIRHIAFTSYPVMQDLQPSVALALSNDPALTVPEEKPVALDPKVVDNIKALPGISIPDGADEAAILAAFAEYDVSKLAVKESKPPEAPPAKKDAPPPLSDDAPPPLSDDVVKQVGKLRGLVLDGMVGVNLTPAQRKEYGDNILGSLSDDAFESTIKCLKLSQVLPAGKSKTPGQDAPSDEKGGLMKATEDRIARSGKR